VAVGADFRTRAPRTDEAIGLLRHLFAGSGGPYRGRFYGYRQGVFAPRPDRPVPVMVGGVSDAALRRAARHADRWQGYGLDAEAFAERAARLRGFQQQTGRAVTAGTRMEWWSHDSTLAEAVGRARALREAGAEELAVYFGHLPGYADRMAAFMEVWRR
jgi:alkanesulfonate monooxygenase SsuD/methylene tetrahydromethanopterin reductase-like flavin-dependent oxidoreductase (luciferase family)